MKGLAEYTSGAKETWRNWQWNRIVERLCGRRNLGPSGMRNVLRDKTVVYLCGPDAFDREVSLRHGFDDCNLIAVDVNNDCIANVRKSGGLGISCTLGELLLNWPCDWRIDAVVADFCCGFEDASQGLCYALWKSHGIKLHTDTMPVISINLQRGRDGINSDRHEQISLIRSMYAALASTVAVFRGPYFRPDGQFNVERINRAGIILDWIHSEYFRHSLGVYSLPHDDKSQELMTFPRRTIDPIDAAAIWATSRAAFDPCFHSYRSKKGGVVMDSAVFSLIPNVVDAGDGRVDLAAREASLDYFLKDDFYYGNQLISDNIKAKIAALRAVRTMKARGSS